MRRSIFCLAAISLFAAGTEYRQAFPGYHYQFPRDHFAHPDFRTEWWYYTGNVHAVDGHRYGFELVFFRQAQRDEAGPSRSVWRADPVYLAHLAMTDIDTGRFRYFERVNRAGPGIAGVSLENGRIWNGNWESRWDTRTGSQTLTAVAEGVRFELRLVPRKPPVIHGENGVSQKAEGAGKASYYVSYPRLAVEGTLNGTRVSGTAWMDHEWFTHQLESSQQGWDWFSVQLENGVDLMLFELRRKDGTVDPYSSGTYISANGEAIHLKRSEFQLQPLETWTSPKTGGRYPIKWRLTVPSRSIDLECRAAVPAQELVSRSADAPTYWEGAVTYSGTAKGVGYLEMTGYGNPMRL